MQITKTSPAFCGKSINIASKAKENMQHTFLYNEVLDVVKKCKVPAVFNNNGIEITYVTKDVEKQLTERGIKFDTKA